MKKFKKLLIAFTGIVVLLLPQACTDNFSSLNTDPALVTEDIIDPDMLFTQSLKNGVFNIVSNGGRVKEYAGMHATTGSSQLFTQANHNNPFNDFYRDYINPLAEAIRLMEGEAENADKQAIARIWKAFLFSQLTDHYGDIPYTEAARSIEEGIVQPVYDTQESIYRDLLSELQEAVDALGSSGSQLSYGSSDILYNGDVTSWERFANSLRLRLAVRVHFEDRDLAETHISDVIDAPLIEERSQNASITTEPANATQEENRNPLYNFVNANQANNANTFCSFTVTDILGDRDDPRLPIYCEPTEEDGSYRGRPVNMESDQSTSYTNETTSKLGLYFKESVYTINVITAAEVSFLKAEAYLYNLASGDAQTAYAEGVNLALSYYDIPQGEIDTYLSGSEGTLSGSEEEMLEQIITQKWISLYQNPIEGWAEIRRTGYPRVLRGSNPGVTNNQFPRRFTYGESEYNLNFDNVSEAGQQMGGDEYMTRFWWDSKEGVLDIEHPFQDEPNEAWPPN